MARYNQPHGGFNLMVSDLAIGITALAVAAPTIPLAIVMAGNIAGDKQMGRPVSSLRHWLCRLTGLIGATSLLVFLVWPLFL